MFGNGLMMIHNTISSGQDDVSELSRRKDLIAPVLNLVDGNVESGRDNSAFVNSSKELDNNLSGSMVVDDLKFTDVSFFLHDLEELNQDFRARSK